MPAFLRQMSQLQVLLSGLSLVALCMLVLAQIVARQLGYMVPDADEIAGYLMAASIFLALPYTLLQGEHIRITLLLSRLPVGARRKVEVLGGGVSLALSGFLAWYSAQFVRLSFEFGDISPGSVPIPMWIPQTAMAIGIVTLFLAIAVHFFITITSADAYLERQ